MKKTKWLKGTDKPVRVGVYQRKILGTLLWTRWFGSRWGVSWYCQADAEGDGITIGSYQNVPWRGIEK